MKTASQIAKEFYISGGYKGVTYLPSVVILDRKEEPSKSRSVSGYGSQLPTQYMIKIFSHLCWNWRDGHMPEEFPWNANKQWRRVYAVCWSNVASHYVIIKKKKWFLHDYDLTGEINFLGLSKNKQS